MKSISCRKHPNWLEQTLEALNCNGYIVIEDVLDTDFLEKARVALYQVKGSIIREIGENRLAQAGELGVLRIMMKYNPFLISFLEIPEVISVIDKTVSETAILHLQNGFILPSFPKGESPEVFQNQFHMDFRRVLNGYLASINTFFALDDFTYENGCTWVVPGSQQKLIPPSAEYLQSNAVPVECVAGSMIVFDSTLWHSAGINSSGKDRLAINQQFTRSYFKQQIDYVRALGDDLIHLQKPRTQQILGYYTRVPTSLEEYYKPSAERLYRSGQG